ncbi:MAG: cytochrome c biogenesis protein ResB [Gloeobacteraceae cyanobacterium ES-bin-144]|nr:cytochrome c biogenesis protein ResB [Verrucomicrobiales bacterium]
MDSSSDPAPRPISKTVGGKVFDVLSGFGFATILLLLLGLLTWFATLEQIDNGLYATLNKYFNWKSVILIPELKGKIVPLVLPGGYWVGVLLLINLTLGGVIRIRKGWRHAGNLISHLGIIFMLVGAGVAHHFSERGSMAVSEGKSSDTAEDYFEYVVEVAEIKDGKFSTIHVIRGDQLEDLTDGNVRLFKFPDVPFGLEIGGYLTNAEPRSIMERAPTRGEPDCDGYYLMEKPGEINAEANTAACYAKVVKPDGTKSDPLILAGASFYPFTVKHDERVFALDMRKRLWPMPFTLNLDKFTAEFHPGTSKPSKFISNITRLENRSEAKVTIQMNEPMRYEGLTFFQASYGPPGAKPGQSMYSVFEVVRNPADKWPEFSLYIVTFGMLVTFLTKFISFLGSNSRKSRNV